MIGTKTIFVLALCLALAAQSQARRSAHREGTTYAVKESRQAGGGVDDWNEDTDIVRTSNSSTATKVLEDPAYVAKANETIVDIIETQGDTETREEVQNQAIINADGTVTNQQVRVKTSTTKTTKTYKISTAWSKSYTVESVKSIVLRFVSTYAPETSDEDLRMFNSIAATDGNRFFSAYNYVQVRAENLETVARTSLNILKIKLDEADIQSFLTSITTCDDENIVQMTNTDLIDVNREDSWTIFAEFYAAKCTKNAKGYQLFTFTSSKSGAWQDGVITSSEVLDASFRIIRNILKPWLWRYAAMMFTCQDAPIQPPCYGNDKPVASDSN